MKIKIDDSYYITSDAYNPAILVRTGINRKTGERVELKRWYCGNKLGAALVDSVEKRVNAMLEEKE